eukprot:3615737-Amphidinium_carterae.1
MLPRAGSLSKPRSPPKLERISLEPHTLWMTKALAAVAALSWTTGSSPLLREVVQSASANYSP